MSKELEQRWLISFHALGFFKAENHKFYFMVFIIYYEKLQIKKWYVLEKIGCTTHGNKKIFVMNTDGIGTIW